MQALALAAVVALAAAAPIPPPPTRWVEDTAGFMTPAARQALDARLAAYQRATGHQVVVWIGHTIGDAALDDWAVRTFAAWRVGRTGYDDGIVMFVLTDDRKVDIEVGYGLEGHVPDAVASRIIREVMAPELRAGNPDAAITGGANALLTAIEGAPWVGAGASTQAPAQPTPLRSYVLGGIALIGFLILMITHPRLAMLLLWSMASSRGGGSIGGVGFGGGGGRSGGGGARGGW